MCTVCSSFPLEISKRCWQLKADMGGPGNDKNYSVKVCKHNTWKLLLCLNKYCFMSYVRIFKHMTLSQQKTNYLYICFQPSIFSRLIFSPDMRKENLLQNIASEGPISSSTFKIETTVFCVTLTALNRTSRRHQYSVTLMTIGVRTSNFIYWNDRVGLRFEKHHYNLERVLLSYLLQFI